MSDLKIAIVAADSAQAKAGLKLLKKRYRTVAPERADAIVALGGDGFMLHTLHGMMKLNKPIFGINRGSVGFLMNEWRPTGLLTRVRKAIRVELRPLRMVARTVKGRTVTSLAINEVSLLRETRQTARIAISVDGKQRLAELFCDGVLVATPAGSTAYNLSAHGPILPLRAGMLALTPISAFRPRRWRGAILPSGSKVVFSVLDAAKRPVSAVADNTEVRDVASVEVSEVEDRPLTLLFDPEQNLEERIVKEQFLT